MGEKGDEERWGQSGFGAGKAGTLFCSASRKNVVNEGYQEFEQKKEWCHQKKAANDQCDGF
ncbi:MAG: hypothetical protein SOZ67_05315 [Alloprevotella sp.]|nr:hypothetical protein [Alloprevotella sp.]